MPPLAVALAVAASLALDGPPLVAPPEVASRAGQLTVDLTAAAGRYRLGGEQFDGMLYQGAYIPPVWVVEPGDTLVVRLANRLAEPTNLHFHGLHVSPRANGDNVFVHVAPGATFEYRVDLPRDHDPGLYWFHPHAHGLVSKQIIAGLSGAIIVGGLERRYPMLRDMRQRVMLLKDIPHPRADWEELVSLNGQLAPTIDVRPGEAQLWRIANIGADLFLRLRLDGARVYAIATDGHPLARPERRDDILLGPGQRIEVVVVGPPPGRYDLRSAPFELEVGKPPLPEHLLGVLVSSSEGQAGAAAERDPAATARRIEAARAQPPPALAPLRRSPVAVRRTFVFTRSDDRKRFFINGMLFGEPGTTVTIPLGSVEEWTIVNEDNQLHNFHLHQTPFLPTEIAGVAQPPDRLMDTITVPSQVGGVPGTVRLKIAFTDPIIVGRFVLHCHVTKHEDKGMMQTIEVQPRPPRPPLTPQRRASRPRARPPRPPQP
jgi:FtsP/CotA-like multicopper oxidase with cupredoxin domain